MGEEFRFGNGTLIGLLVIAVAIATLTVLSLVLLRKRQYGTISHGIVEVSVTHTGFLYQQSFGIKLSWERVC